MSRGDPENKRTRDVRVRLTPAEWELWDAAREASGRREMGAWLRALVTEILTGALAGRRPGDLPRVVVPEVSREAVDELRRIGVNINQLAHRANAEGRVVDVDELRRALVELEDAMRLVRGQRPPRVVTPDPTAADGGPGPEPVGDVDQAVADTTPESAAARAAAILARVATGRGETPEPPPRRRWFGSGSRP